MVVHPPTFEGLLRQWPRRLLACPSLFLATLSPSTDIPDAVAVRVRVPVLVRVRSCVGVLLAVPVTEPAGVSQWAMRAGEIGKEGGGGLATSS